MSGGRERAGDRRVGLRRLVSGAAVIALSASFSLAARAEESEPPPKRWYGAPILYIAAPAGAALGAEAIVALHGDNVSPALWVPTLAAWLGTGPVVHALNDEPVRGLASVGLDAIGVVAGFGIGFNAVLFQSGCDHGLPHEDETKPRCSVVPFFVFMELGFVGGPLIDGALVAKHRAGDRAAASLTAIRPFVLPASADRRERGVTLGITGAL